jgi:hypothetical protein
VFNLLVKKAKEKPTSPAVRVPVPIITKIFIKTNSGEG